MSPQLPLPFSVPYAPDDQPIAERLLAEARLTPKRETRIDRTARRLIDAIKQNDDPLGGVQDMLREFALSTKEGLALMVLAEALLRVPDAGTADRFIEDRLGQGNFIHHETKSSAFLVNASTWALGLSARVIQPGETPQGTIGRLAQTARRSGDSRGDAAGDAADGQSVRARRNHRGCARARRTRIRADATATPSTCSARARAPLRMRTAISSAYAHAIEAIGRGAGTGRCPSRPGISVKLSALHPRYEPRSASGCCAELMPRADRARARRAKALDIGFTVDAEEADRLELSLDVIAARCRRAARSPAGTGSASPSRPIGSAPRAVIDWLDDARARARPAADGAAGQGRLLGHRDQARAGARPRRIIQCSPARPRPTSATSPAPRGCWRRGRASTRSSRPTMR